MKIQARTRLEATVVEADLDMEDGVAFDTLIDGDPSQEEPEVQELTRDDGGIEEAPEQSLLMDDIQVA